jgi:15-hydroxyprostaglandin dehydrogenase (NAD)
MAQADLPRRWLWLQAEVRDLSSHYLLPYSEQQLTNFIVSASGMGLGVVERLVGLGWNVAIVDFNEKTATKVTERLGAKTIFVKANVIDYEQQANAFVETFNKWHRIDLVFANAGIGDRINFFAPSSELMANGAPKKPDSLVVDICLYGCIWASYLGMHYFRKNPDGVGKIVMTSSMCGIYSGDSIPLYTAAKHGASSSNPAVKA